MPAVSKAQLRFMAAVASGRARKKPKGLSRAEASEFVHATPSAKELPERVSKKLKKLHRKGRK